MHLSQWTYSTAFSRHQTRIRVFFPPSNFCNLHLTILPHSSKCDWYRHNEPTVHSHLVFLCVFSWSDIGPQKHPAKRKLKHRNLGKFRFYSLTKVLYMFSLQHMLSRDSTSLFHFKQKDRRRHPKANLEIVCLGLWKLKEKGSSILVSTVDSICCSTDP